MRVITKPEHSGIEWQSIRHRDPEGNVVFGASESASLLNRSEYESQGDLITRKLLPPATSESSPAMDTGNLFEPTLIAEASRRLGIEIVTPDLMFGQGRFVATPDGIDAYSYKRILSHEATKKTPDIWVEAKCTSRYQVASVKDIPEAWSWQMAAQRYVTKADSIYLIVLDSRLHINLIEVPPNPEAEQVLIDTANKIGDMIDSGSIREQMVDQLSADQIARLWVAEDKTIELPANAVELIESFVEAKAKQNEWQAIESEAKDAIARMMLDAQVGTIDGQQIITWKEQAGRSGFDAKQFAIDNPTLFAKYQKTGDPFRVMRVSKKKGK